jgi:hypothetical protein
LAKDPAERFPSAAALAAAARSIGTPATEIVGVAEPAATATQPALRPATSAATTGVTPVRGSRRRTAVLLSAAVAGVAAILALPAFLDRGAPPPNGEQPASVTPARPDVTAGQPSGAGVGAPSSGAGQTSASPRSRSTGQALTGGPGSGASPPRAPTESPARSTAGPEVPLPTALPVTSAPVGAGISPPAAAATSAPAGPPIGAVDGAP